MPTQLTYAIRTTPAPLTAGATDASITLLATNETDKPISLEGISISIPVGTAADDLTNLPDQIVGDSPKGWKENPPNKSQPGVYKVIFVPEASLVAQEQEPSLETPAQKTMLERLVTLLLRLILFLRGRSQTEQEEEIRNSLVTTEGTQPTVSVPANGSLTFTLTKVATNNQAGSVQLTITQGTKGKPEKVLKVSKVPTSWKGISFTATPPDLPATGDVTLNWNGPKGATYTIEYIDPSTQKPVNIPMAGQPPLANSGKYPGSSDPKLQITATTEFTLTVTQVVHGKSLKYQPQQTVSVGEVPKISSFKGRLAGEGTSRKLLLSWTTTDANYVDGSWAYGKELDANPTEPISIDPPFNTEYTITAFAATGKVKSQAAKIQLGFKKLTTITTDSYPNAITITPDGSKALVSVRGGVSVIDVKNQKLSKTIEAGESPLASPMAMTPDGNSVLVVNSDDNTVSAIDIKKLKVTSTISVGNFPVAIAISPDSTLAFVANQGSKLGGKTVSVIDITSSKVTHTITVGGAPNTIATTPDGTLTFVTNFNDKTVSVIDVEKMSVTQTISIGSFPGPITISPDGSLAFILPSEDGTEVKVIDIKEMKMAK
ncbi:MAG: YncE family protein, partial [Bacteroidota bacterium]